MGPLEKRGACCLHRPCIRVRCRIVGAGSVAESLIYLVRIMRFGKVSTLRVRLAAVDTFSAAQPTYSVSQKLTSSPLKPSCFKSLGQGHLNAAKDVVGGGRSTYGRFGNGHSEPAHLSCA